MKEALKLAQKAMKKGEVPVGAVIVRDGIIIARGYNRKERTHLVTRHAEIDAIEQACKKLNDWRLVDCEMYVTLEPCCMCAGAIVASRMQKVYIGAMESNNGCCGSKYNLLQSEQLNSKVEVETGILAKESVDLLQEFFVKRRLK